MEEIQGGRMKKGSYALLISLGEEKNIELSTGIKQLKKGFYVYFGSAFGPGGLKRIERHREVSKGKRDVKHWHIDYLTRLESSEIIDTVKFPGEDIECDMASRADKRVEGFGSTDCGCGSHLAYFSDKKLARTFIEELRAAYPVLKS